MKTLSKKVVSLLIALAMLISIAPASMAEDLFIIQWGTQYHLKDGASNLSGTIFDVEDLANKVFAGRPSGFAIGGWYIDENYTTTWNGSNDSGNIYAYTNVADNQSTYEALLKGTASGLYANKFGTILIRGTQSGSTSSFNQTSAITMNASRTVTLKSYYSGGASIRLLNLTNTWHIIATGNANVIDITFIDVQLRGHNSGGISNGTTGTNGSTVNLRGNNTIPGFANISECRGSGIYNNRTLNLYGNIKIANNNAPNGGGVYSIGTFNMYDDALISNNTATLGGGVYNSIIGSTFKMYDNSSINGNTASDSGGGVYNNSARIDMYDSASISNNTATNNGGGIWTHASNLGNITAAVDVVFEGNSASAGACLMTNSSDITLHNSRILTKTRSLSIPFRYTYNNYDISYTSGTLIKGSMPQVPSVFGMPFTYHLKDGTNTITNTSTNPTVQVYQGRPEGFDIGAWFTDSSYTTLWNGTDVTPLYAYSNVADDHATFQGLIKGTASGAYRADNGLFSTVLVRGTPQSGDKSSFNLTSAITLGNDDAGRNVTFKSYYSGGAHIITAISARHFDISIIAANKISFTFVDVQLQGRNPLNVGGGVIHRLGTLNLKGANTIEGFANIANCRNVTGGGLDNRYTVNLRGNMAISNNVSTGVGGGVYVGSSVNDYSTLNMYDTSKISGNEALKNNGGGVHIVNGRVNMYDSSAISGNTSTLDQYFQGEYVGGNGGGVHINSISPGTLYMYDNSTISNNFAEADGGGVWTPNLLNVTAASGTTFAGNTAGNGAYLIQYVLGMLSSANAGDIAIHGTRIFTDTVSPPKPPFEYAYNNYDINYKKGDLWNSSGHTPAPTAIPTSAPTAGSTSVPTSLPTATPTSVPSPASTLLPTQTPSSVPSPASTLAPTLLPTQAPTSVPSPRPTLEPGATERPTPISWGDTTTNGGDATEGDGNGEGQIVVEGVGSIDVSGLEDRIYDGT